MQHLNLAFTRRLSWVFLMALMLTACGFQLRGSAPLSFTKLNIQGGALSIKKDLIRLLQVNHVKIVDSAEDAEMLLELLNERTEKRILSLSGGGLVREFELYYTVNFRTRPQSNPLWGKVQTLQMRRSFSYNDNVLLGKAEEEAGLYADMRKESVIAILRRLSATEPEQL